MTRGARRQPEGWRAWDWWSIGAVVLILVCLLVCPDGWQS